MVVIILVVKKIYNWIAKKQPIIPVKISDYGSITHVPSVRVTVIDYNSIEGIE